MADLQFLPQRKGLNGRIQLDSVSPSCSHYLNKILSLFVDVCMCVLYTHEWAGVTCTVLEAKGGHVFLCHSLTLRPSLLLNQEITVSSKIGWPVSVGIQPTEFGWFLGRV